MPDGNVLTVLAAHWPATLPYLSPDDLAFIADWGFPLGAGAPVTVWQGDQDMMVPFGHGKWLAASLPAARAHLIPGAGHLSLAVGQFAEILDDLLSVAGVR